MSCDMYCPIEKYEHVVLLFSTHKAHLLPCTLSLRWMSEGVGDILTFPFQEIPILQNWSPDLYTLMGTDYLCTERFTAEIKFSFCLP